MNIYRDERNFRGQLLEISDCVSNNSTEFPDKFIRVQGRQACQGPLGLRVKCQVYRDSSTTQMDDILGSGHGIQKE